MTSKRRPNLLQGRYDYARTVFSRPSVTGSKHVVSDFTGPYPELPSWVNEQAIATDRSTSMSIKTYHRLHCGHIFNKAEEYNTCWLCGSQVCSQCTKQCEDCLKFVCLACLRKVQRDDETVEICSGCAALTFKKCLTITAKVIVFLPVHIVRILGKPVFRIEG